MQELMRHKPGPHKRRPDIAAIEQLVHRRSWNVDGTANLVLEVGAVRRMGVFFERLESQLQKIQRTNGPAWRTDHRGMHTLSIEGKFLWLLMRDIDQEASALLTDGRRLNPWIRVGLHVCRKWGPRLRRYMTLDHSLDLNIEYCRRMMSHIFLCIRRLKRNKRFRGAIKNEARKANKNYQSGAKLVVAAFEECARWLVLRFDLYFEGDAKDLSESIAAQQAFSKFKEAFRDGRIVPGAMYLIAKREDGLERRIHFHVMVLLDGDKHEDAYRLTEAMGKFWEVECVGSPVLSGYFNCWLRRHEYKHNCVGVVHYSDQEMVKGIRDALVYMTKQEPHVLVHKALGRNFFRSNLPKRRGGANRRGAPRKDPDSMRTVRRILLGQALQVIE